MVRRASEKDRVRILAFLQKAPDANLFLIGDIENEGFDRAYQEVWVEEKESEVQAVFLRFWNYFLYTTHDPGRPVDSFLEILREKKVESLAGTAENLQGFLQSRVFEKERVTYFSRCDQLVQEPHFIEGLRKATLKDVPALRALREKITEFETTDASIEAMADGIRRGTGEVFLLEREGQVVASAGLTAENRQSAMVVGVCTHPGHRNKGYASACVEALIKRPLLEGKFLCLFYDNPSAGHIYKRLGFVPRGRWMLLTGYRGVDQNLKFR